MPSSSRKHSLRSRFIRIYILLAIFFLVFFFFLYYSANNLIIQPSQITLSATARATVQKVIDGDTIDVVVDGKRERVRLIGIDAPEVEYEDKLADCFAGESAARLKDLIGGKTVSLSSDPTQEDRDSYDRLLRFVYLPDNTNINKKMIEEGYAYEYTYKGIPYQYQKEFQDAESEAKKLKKGFWTDGACQ